MDIEFRWAIWSNVGHKQLQYRIKYPAIDASGAFCPSNEWSEWKNVPSVDGTKL